MPLILLPASLLAPVVLSFGGGPTGKPVSDCLTRDERTNAEAVVRDFHARYGQSSEARAKYQVFPMGGVLGDDLFPNNYVDLDPSTGLKDWDCSAFTYDGHLGIDIDLKSFDDQEGGLPIFAALGGTVVETDDGNFDHNVIGDGQPGNHVILYHGGTHYSLYWHLKRTSILVKAGDTVKAGQQIGSAASSGNSTGPHLHFESWSNLGSQFAFEPHTGTCNPGETGWVGQQPVPRQFYVRDINLTTCDFSAYAGWPWEMPRGGSFLTGTRLVGFTALVQNLPLLSTFRVRFLRPNGSLAFDSGTGSFNNSSSFRESFWWWRYQVSLNSVGTWKAELTVNGQVACVCPFRVNTTYPLNRNLAPYPVTIAFVNPSEPGAPLSVKVVSPTLIDDPDYDLVKYRYVWKQSNQVVRDVTSVGHLDMIPGDSYKPHRDLSVTVTPMDGLAEGISTTVHTKLSLRSPSD